MGCQGMDRQTCSKLKVQYLTGRYDTTGGGTPKQEACDTRPPNFFFFFPFSSAREEAKWTVQVPTTLSLKSRLLCMDA